MSRATSIRTATDWLLITLFAALVCVPPILALTGPRQVYSKEEKRFLAKFPALDTGQGFTAFARAFDRYYQDHFGLREFFIHRYHREVNKRFERASAPDVLTGKDGWLFYTGERMLDNLTGRYPLSPQQLEQLAARTRDTRAWLQGKGIAYLLVVAPDKQSIYPEHLPDHYQRARGATRLDQAVAALKRDPATAFLDLRPVLLRNKDRQRLYDKTDTHWNQAGAFIASRELLRAVSERFPGLDFQDSFSVGALWRKDPAGDLAQLSGRGEALAEMRPEVLGWLRAEEHELAPALRQLLLPEQLEPLYTVREGRGLRVLVLHDSFMNPMKPFLSESFGEVLYVWKYFERNIENFLNQELMEQVLAEFRPDLVIDEVVERHLDWLLRGQGTGAAAGTGAPAVSP